MIWDQVQALQEQVHAFKIPSYMSRAELFPGKNCISLLITLLCGLTGQVRCRLLWLLKGGRLPRRRSWSTLLVADPSRFHPDPETGPKPAALAALPCRLCYLEQRKVHLVLISSKINWCTVWPNLAKFSSLCQFFRVYLVFWKIFNLLVQSILSFWLNFQM